MTETSPSVPSPTPVPGAPRAPRVFISYAHDSDAHREQVRDLWIFLCAHGVDAQIDRVAAEQRQDWPRWMEQQVARADRILIVASPAYRERAGHEPDPAVGRGVQWEARLIRDLYYRNQNDHGRFLPVVLPGGSGDDLPGFLTPASSTVYRVSEFTVPGAEPLLRVIHGRPGEVQPVIGPVPDLPTRDHTPISTGAPVGGSASPRSSTTPLVLKHEVDVRLAVDDHGVVATTVTLGGARLGDPHRRRLPVGIEHCWDNLDLADVAADRIAGLGVGLWTALFDEQTSRRLLELVDTSLVGTLVDLVFRLPESLSWLPVELLRVPTDQRLLATIAGVSLTRRLAGIDRAPVGGLAGPLKILAAVAAPEETKTGSAAVDVEAEMQALLDAVTTATVGGQVRILEVASADQISQALRAGQYHVLHLFAHGSADPPGIELEDEDGNPVFAPATVLVDALKAGGRVLPLVVLSSCSGAAGGTAGLAAALVRQGADRVLAMHTTVTDAYATALGRRLYHALASDPEITVAAAVAIARHDTEQHQHNLARTRGLQSRPEAAIPTLLAAGPDTPLINATAPVVPLGRHTQPPDGRGVRELPLGELIGRRAPLRAATAVLRGDPGDRERYGDWIGVALTGIGGIGKTALAGRIVTRARANRWRIAEHVGTWNPPALFDSLAATVGDPELAAQLRDAGEGDASKLGYLLQALRQERLMVLFDDFEQNLTPDTRAFTDRGFAELFRAMLDHAQQGRVLTTCRYPIPDTRDALLRLDLPPLTAAEQRRLYLRLPALHELDPDERKLIGDTIGGHPRLIEFLDVLLRHGTPARFRHVTTNLRALADAEDINPGDPHPLPEAVTTALQLGSRDIFLQTLTADLTADQRELLAQAALSRASFTLADLTYTGRGNTPNPEESRAVRRDVEHLTDLTLITPTTDREMLVHPWLADTLSTNQPEPDRTRRHAKAAQMRIHRINIGRGRFTDYVEVSRHLALAGDYDRAVAATFHACGLVGGEFAAAALLAEIIPLIPTTHPRHIALADRECTALIKIGLVNAATDRYRAIHAVAEHKAAANPGNAGYQDDLAVSHDRLGWVAAAAGDTTTADQHYRTSHAIIEELAAADASNTRYQHDQATSQIRFGDLAVAAGATTTADQHFRTSLAITERLAAADPDNTEYQRSLAVSHDRLGDLAVAAGDATTADRHFRIALAIRERLAAADASDIGYQRALAVSHDRLGHVAVAAGATTTADQHFRTSLAITERLAAADPDNTEYQRSLAVSHDRLGDLAVAAGATTTADQHFRTSLAITERLAAADPDNTEYQRSLAVSHDRLGDLAVAAGATTAADQHLRTSLAIAERLVEIHSGEPRYQRDLAVSYDKLGKLALEAGELTLADRHFRTRMAIAERLATADPGDIEYQRDLATSHERLGDLAVTTEDATIADQHFRASLAIRERISAIDPGNARYQSNLAVSHDRIGNLAAAAGDATTADRHFRIALAFRERLATADPSNIGYQRDLAVSQDRIGDLAAAAGDSTTADRHFRIALAIRERLATADPSNIGYQRDLAVSHDWLGDLAAAAENLAASHQHYRISLAIRQLLAAADPYNSGYQRDLSVSHSLLGELAVRVGDRADADQHFRTSLAITERLAAANPDNVVYQRGLDYILRWLSRLGNADPSQ